MHHPTYIITIKIPTFPLTSYEVRYIDETAEECVCLDQEEEDVDRHHHQDCAGARLQPEQQTLQRGGLLHLRVSQHGEGRQHL